MKRTAEIKQLHKQLQEVEYKISNGRKSMLVVPMCEFSKVNAEVCQLEVKRQTLQYKLQQLKDNKPILGDSDNNPHKMNPAPSTFKSHKQ